MHIYNSDGRHAWFHLYGTSRPVRSASEAKKYKMKNSCPQWDSNPQPWDRKSDALPTELAGLVVCCLFKWPYYIMYSRNLCIHFHYYKYENIKGQRILSGKSTVLCYILDIYRNVVQIEKRHTSPALAFNMKTWPNILPDLVLACWKQAQDLCVSLLFVQYTYIPICNTKQYIYKIDYALLHHSRTYNKVYIGIGSTCT